MQTELQIIAAETQSPIDIELAKRGDIVSLVNLHEKINQNYEKVLMQAAKFQESAQQHRDAAAATAAQRATANALAERRVDNAEDREDRLSGGGKGKGEDTLRKEYTARSKPITEYERDITKVRAALASGIPLGDVEARQLLTNLSKGARGTNMQMKLTQNFGDIGTRLGGFFTNFLSGKMTDSGPGSQREQFKNYLDAIEGVVVKPELEALQNEYRSLARDRKLDPHHIIYGSPDEGGAAAPSHGATDGWGDDPVAAAREKFKY